MTGEIDFEDTFNNEDGEGDKVEGSGGGNDTAKTEKVGQLLTYRVVHLVFFLAFLISVPVGFYNLLTGFALDKVMVREKQVENNRRRTNVKLMLGLTCLK